MLLNNDLTYKYHPVPFCEKTNAYSQKSFLLEPVNLFHFRRADY
jgi:hypothetical protein